MAVQGYNITEIGNWPTERYDFKPITTIIDPALAALVFRNDIRVYNNPNLDINLYSKNFIYPYNATIGVAGEFFTVNFIDATSSLIFAASSLRLLQYDTYLNYFALDTDYSDATAFTGFVFYPKKLFLKPQSVTKNGASDFTLTAKATIIDKVAMYFQDPEPRNNSISAYYNYLYRSGKYLDTNDVTQTLPYSSYPTGGGALNNQVLFYYGLSSTQSIIRQPVINFTQSYNPLYNTQILEPNNTITKRIRWQSPVIEYNARFQSFDDNNKPYIESLSNFYYDYPLQSQVEFNSPVSFLYSPATDKNLLTLMLVQSGVNDGRGFLPQDSRNCVLSATLNLQTTNLIYQARGRTLAGGTVVNVVSGQAGTQFNISYVLDTDNIKYFYNNEPVQNTLIPSNTITVGGVSDTLNVYSRGTRSIGSTTSDTVVYRTKYPPHYYSYNLGISSINLPRYTETSNLSFNLSAYTLQNTSTSTRLRTHLYSDFNSLYLDLPTYGYNSGFYVDKIKYVPEFTEGFLLSSISAFLLRSTHVPYSLLDPVWVDAYNSDVLEITFPKNFAGTPSFSLRPTLSTLVGVKNALYCTNVTLTGLYTFPQYPLYMEILQEGEDYIDISAASMVTSTQFPGIDLRNTTIKWSITPLTDPNIQVNFLWLGADNVYKPISAIPLNTSLPFNSKTWAIRVSGYGPTPIQVGLYSDSLNIFTAISSDPTFFDYFTNKKLLIDPIQKLNNYEKVRTISLSASIPYKNRKYPLPKDRSIYWNWSYDNTFDNLSTPITAKYFINNTISSAYLYGDINNASALSALYFYISPPEKSSTPITHNIRINVFTNDTIVPYSGTYQFFVDDYPSKNIFNADFSLAYSTYPSVQVLNTRNENYVLTRPDNDHAIFTVTPNTDIIPIINPKGYLWTIIKDGVTTYNSNSIINIDTTGTFLTEVKFKVLSAAPAGWPYEHNIDQQIKIYRLPTSVFYKPLEFDIFSQYAWPNSNQVTVLNFSNYKTLSVAPTAYGYKVYRTELFNVSATPYFNTYKYTAGYPNYYLGEIPSNTSQVVIPYNTQFYSETGIYVSLTAFNDYYPSNTPLLFQMVEGGNLTTKNYYITAKTIPYNKGTSSTLQFKQNPKLIDYNGIFYTFSATVTSFDLDVNRRIYIKQNIHTSELNAPAYPDNSTSTITYILSTENWVSKKNVPAINGEFLLFQLRTGDSLNELTVDNAKNNSLYLNASSDLNIRIPQSTWNDYIAQNQISFIPYPTNYWESKNVQTSAKNTDWKTLVAYATSSKPEIFLNTRYTITASPIFVEFFTPLFEKNPITSYAVNFGENVTSLGNINATFNYQYSSIGTFFVSYSAFYQNGNYDKFTISNPIIVKDKWEEYTQENIRVLGESILQLPYTLEEIMIQPNEFGDKDIFNTSLTRLNECLEYLKSNMQTMNIDSPIYYYGWLGNNKDFKSNGIRWYTETYGPLYYKDLSFASSEGFDYFTNIKDINYKNKYFYVLDDKIFRVFNYDNHAIEIEFKNKSELIGFFIDPKSITVSDDEISIFVADSIRNKIYRFDFDFSDPLTPIFGLVLSLGSYGSLNDAGKFDYPSEIHYYNDNIFVLDYNNNCVKQYTRDLSWVHTYYDNILKGDQIQNIAIHPTGLLYIITKSYKIHIFDIFGESVIKTIQLYELNTLDEVVKISFDENGEFLYVLTKKSVFKYSAVGEYVTSVILPDLAGSYLSSAYYSKYRSMNFATSNYIIRVQDFVEIFKIGNGLEADYWNLDQILLKKEQFAQDTTYNSALIKIAQNLKTLRNTINAQFALVTEQTSRGSVSYFSLLPISVNRRPQFLSDVENEFLLTGANEFHIPTVLNRELTKLYDSLITLKTNLDVTTTNTSNVGDDDNPCGADFCWSWKAMACYNLSLPIIRLCNTNPITYAELVNTFPVSYAPTKIWGDANSVCCNDVVSPLG